MAIELVVVLQTVVNGRSAAVVEELLATATPGDGSRVRFRYGGKVRCCWIASDDSSGGVGAGTTTSNEEEIVGVGVGIDALAMTCTDSATFALVRFNG